MTKAAAPVKMQAARLDSADFTSPTTDSASMADALMDVLHISELSAMLCDGEDLTTAQEQAIAAGITALADSAAQRLANHVNGGTV